MTQDEVKEAVKDIIATIAHCHARCICGVLYVVVRSNSVCHAIAV